MEPAGFPRQTVFAVKLPRTLLHVSAKAQRSRMLRLAAEEAFGAGGETEEGNDEARMARSEVDQSAAGRAAGGTAEGVLYLGCCGDGMGGVGAGPVRRQGAGGGDDKEIAGILEGPGVKERVVRGQAVGRGDGAAEGDGVAQVAQVARGQAADRGAGVDVVVVERAVEEAHTADALEELEVEAEVVELMDGERDEGGKGGGVAVKFVPDIAGALTLQKVWADVAAEDGVAVGEELGGMFGHADAVALGDVEVVGLGEGEELGVKRGFGGVVGIDEGKPGGGGGAGGVEAREISAAVALVPDGDARVFTGEGIGHGAGLVGRAVVDNADGKRGKGLGAERGDGAGQGGRGTARRNDDGDEGGLRGHVSVSPMEAAPHRRGQGPRRRRARCSVRSLGRGRVRPWLAARRLAGRGSV